MILPTWFEWYHALAMMLSILIPIFFIISVIEIIRWYRGRHK